MAPIPPALAAVLRPVLPEVAGEIIRAIGREVPDYSRPMEGPFGVALRDGVERALRRFVATIERPEAIRPGDRRVYIELGRGERRQGRSLNALLAAYRVGAQVAWRRFVEAGMRADIEPQAMYSLGEAIFAYIDEISGESIEGYAAEQSAAAREQQRRRTQLVRMLAADPAPAPDALRAAADRAGWPLPAQVAALVVEDADPDEVTGRLGAGAVAASLEGTEEASVGDRARSDVLAFVPDAGAPGTRARVEQAVGRGPAALGPVVMLEESARSAARARRVLELDALLELSERPLIVADEHQSALLLHADPGLAAELAAARLRPLEELRGPARERLRATLRMWLDRQGRVDETARALGVHPQTVRYRVGQLREAFGPALEDPEARFELEVALRVSPGRESD